MMFQCFNCCTRFDDINQTVKHLKRAHSILENNEPTQCCVNLLPKCKATYLSFGGLRNHMKNCILSKSNVSSLIVK